MPLIFKLKPIIKHLMSLIYTGELAGANVFDYLSALQRHPEQVALSPSDWMPWNYKQTCAAL